MTDQAQEPAAPPPDFPEARIREASSWRGWLSQSTLPIWLVTAACVVIAACLSYRELSPSGEPIVIQFQNGYGVEPEDHVRYRGIVVGEVDRVQLADTMRGVNVHVRLNEDASSLAREGTQFWVARPEVSLGEIRGLDTLVGGRYVAVLPGPEGSAKQTEFIGLEDSPANVDMTDGGLALTLLAEERWGLERGAPVSYRGMAVGNVLSVSLSENASNVIVRAVVKEPYRHLVRANSQFWSNGGIHANLGLGGFDLDIDTLASLAVGGIAFATPHPSGDPPGDDPTFELLSEEVEGWRDWQPLPDGGETGERPSGLLNTLRSRFSGERDSQDKN